MAHTIIYYDESGEILFSASGDYKKPTGQVSTIETEIPDGYIPVSVGEGGEVITEALPLTSEQQRLAALEAQMNALIGAEEADTGTDGTDETEA